VASDDLADAAFQRREVERAAQQHGLRNVVSAALRL
jgi:hypothetical protein